MAFVVERRRIMRTTTAPTNIFSSATKTKHHPNVTCLQQRSSRLVAPPPSSSPGCADPCRPLAPSSQEWYDDYNALSRLHSQPPAPQTTSMTRKETTGLSRSSLSVSSKSSSAATSTTGSCCPANEEHDLVSTVKRTGNAHGLLPSPLPPVKCSSSFPFKLHTMLNDAKKVGFEHVVSWLTDAKSFKVHDKEKFESDILFHYFRGQTQYKSFQRQLNIYGFIRIVSGKFHETGGYTHEFLVRGKPQLCHFMVRTKVKGPTKTAAHRACPGLVESSATTTFAVLASKENVKGLPFITEDIRVTKRQEQQSPTGSVPTATLRLERPVAPSRGIEVLVPITTIENNHAPFLGNGAFCDFPDICPKTEILYNNYSPLHLAGGDCAKDVFVLYSGGVEDTYNSKQQKDLHMIKADGPVSIQIVGRSLFSSLQAPVSTDYYDHGVCLESLVENDKQMPEPVKRRQHFPAHVIAQPSFSTFVVGSACGGELSPPPYDPHNHAISADSMVLIAGGTNITTSADMCTWDQRNHSFQQLGLQPAVAAELVKVFDG